MKIKMGIYAPVKATGTDGFCIEDSEILEKEGKLIPFSPNRVGSSTVGFGARRGRTTHFLHEIKPNL